MGFVTSFGDMDFMRQVTKCPNLKMSEAQHFDNPTLLITWFKNLNAGALRSDAQDAIEQAASNDDAFKTAWNEHVD